MSRTIRTEKRRRGIFGTIVWWIFLAYNAFMIYWMYALFTVNSEQISSATSNNEQAVAVVAGGITFGMSLFLWFLGSVILGLIVMLSRGRKVIVEETVN